MISVMDSIAKAGIPLPSLLKQQLGNFTQNGTDAKGSSDFPPSIMDSFLMTAGSMSPLSQLLLFVYRLLGAYLGIDPSLILTLLGFLWGLQKLSSQVMDYFNGLIRKYFMCSMSISEEDRIFDHLMKWMAEHPSINNNKYLTAQTVWKSAWEEEDDDEEECKSVFLTDGGDTAGSERKYLNFSNQAARSVSTIRIC